LTTTVWSKKLVPFIFAMTLSRWDLFG